MVRSDTAIRLPVRLGNGCEIIAKLIVSGCGFGGLMAALYFFSISWEIAETWPAWLAFFLIVISFALWPFWLALRTPWAIDLRSNSIRVSFLFSAWQCRWDQVSEVKYGSEKTYLDLNRVLFRHPAVWIELEHKRSVRVLLSKKMTKLFSSAKGLQVDNNLWIPLVREDNHGYPANGAV